MRMNLEDKELEKYFKTYSKNMIILMMLIFGLQHVK